jgi:hypothetical protein
MILFLFSLGRLANWQIDRLADWLIVFFSFS